MSLICSVLKPFGDLSTLEKQQSVAMFGKKSKSYVPYFFENVQKYQSESVSVEILLNRYLSIVPFKPYFEGLYRLCEIFGRLEMLADLFDELRPASVHQQLINILSNAGCSLTGNGPVGSSSSSQHIHGSVSNQMSLEEHIQFNELIMDAVNKLDSETNLNENKGQVH